ncbi:SAM-dependent methyltransferase [Prosthecobacter sp. SYSU 5D2]|uniref:SAM-dependent methyltransferase n=1 Tax=Prosthecobacter sp. SYSU 5D2 TaxID=3134134 RepID=UPI0031FF210A
MHAFLPAADCAAFLVDELQRAGTGAHLDSSTGFVHSDALPALPWLAFARQTLPEAAVVKDASINGWADQIITRIAGLLPDAQPWRLHLWPAYGEGRAGLHRCDLIRTALHERLKKRRRALLRSLEESDMPFLPGTSLVQAVLTGPDAGYISVSQAPQPVSLRAIISPFIGGDIPHAEDKAAPSRAFAKVIEAELRLGQQIERGQTCVDLGASPGSWSYVAIQRGAHVTAIDRSPLRDDLMRNPRLSFLQADAFKYKPEQPVDWLICDIIAAPQRSMDLLVEWLREKRMRRFIVTLKFKGTDEYPLMDSLKELAPPLCADFRLTRLCANKNEVTAFGVAAAV